jgi:hypothetical protein
MIVAYPTRYAKNVRLAFDKPAEPDSLHASANHKSAGLYRFLSGIHAPKNVILAENQFREREADSQSSFATLSPR